MSDIVLALSACLVAAAIVVEARRTRLLMRQSVIDLGNRVANITSVAASAVAVIQHISEQIDQAVENGNLEEDSDLAQLGLELDSSATTLGNAIAANTAATTPGASEPPLEEPNQQSGTASDNAPATDTPV